MRQTTNPRLYPTRDLDVSVASQRRRQIIAAARDCITEDGVEKLTLRKVAERAQVSHATITYYFRSRKELVDSALVELSDEFLEGLRHRERLYGMGDLRDLLETFLDPENMSARFVVQMIDAGQHDPELRSKHDEFIQYGIERIELSMRVAMEMGEMRTDIDPGLAAALLHSVLIWWQSELATGSGSRDRALDIGRLLLGLLSYPNPPANDASAKRTPGEQMSVAPRELTTPAIIGASLINDPNLSREAQETLAASFTSLYRLAAGQSRDERGA